MSGERDTFIVFVHEFVTVMVLSDSEVYLSSNGRCLSLRNLCVPVQINKYLFNKVFNQNIAIKSTDHIILNL